MNKFKIFFERNIARVESLCNLYSSLRAEDIREGQDYKFTDILRSAVVMLHSAFEEYFRNTLRFVIPRVCKKSDLKNISFVGSEGKYKEKISLGELLSFRNKTVEELIRESIDETLLRTSFNSFFDIRNWAEKANIDLSAFHQHEKLENLINRRHKIVHEADNSRVDDGYGLTSIKEETVRGWIIAVCDLVNLMQAQLK